MYFNFFKRTNTVCVLRFSIIARDQLQNRVTIMSIPYLRLSFYLFLHMPTSYQLSLSLKHNASQANIQRDMPCLNNAKHLDKICHCSHTIKSEIHRYIANVNGRLNMIYRTRLNLMQGSNFGFGCESLTMSFHCPQKGKTIDYGVPKYCYKKVSFLGAKGVPTSSSSIFARYFLRLG